MRGSRISWHLVCVLALAVPVGCGGSGPIEIGALEPAPSIGSARPPGPVALSMTASTPDHLRVETHGFRSVEIRAFRRTLENGFARAFGHPMAASPGEASGLRLSLEVRRVAFVTRRVSEPSAGRWRSRIVLVHGAPHTPTTKTPKQRRYVLLEFSAALQDGGQELGRVSGRVTSEAAAVETGDSVATAIASAVAELYEAVARELFARRTAGGRG